MDARLVPRVTSFATREQLEAFLTSVALRLHVEELGPVAGAALVREVAERLPERELHWVRLEVVARRANAGRESRYRVRCAPTRQVIVILFASYRKA